MKKLFFGLFAITFIGCSSTQNNDKIIFIRLEPRILYDTIGTPRLYLNQYAEFRFNSGDSLFIGKSESKNTDTGNFSQFGLEKFYVYNVEDDFVDLMTKIVKGSYKDSYVRKLSQLSIDDRQMCLLIIFQNGTQRIIEYCELESLPRELKQADSLIAIYANVFQRNISHKPNYSEQIILNVQDSLFRKFPPPLKSTIQFIHPKVPD